MGRSLMDKLFSVLMNMDCILLSVLITGRSIYCICCLYLLSWVPSWPNGSALASHHCCPGSIPGWGSDPGPLSEKSLHSPGWTTLHPWVGTLSCWPSLPTSTKPIQERNPQHFLKRVGKSPRYWWPVLYRMHSSRWRATVEMLLCMLFFCDYDY